jgi:hypothetical protein
MRTLVYAATVLAFLTCAFAQGTHLATQYVDCERNARGENVASREMKTPVFTSKLGDRAYGIVIARLVGTDCKYGSTIYLSKGMGEYQVIFKQEAEQNPDTTWFEGSGVQNLRWSPDGENLLVEIFQWKNGSDAAGRTKYLIFNRDHSSSVKEIGPEELVYNWFHKDCSPLMESTGWIDETHIGIQVKPFTLTDEEGKPDKTTPTCVDKPNLFSFDVGKGKVLPVSSAKKQ